jgi:conjugal transfer pilus assembly protein TrbC
VPGRIDRLAGLALFLPCALLAQPPQWPTVQDMERAVKQRPFPNAERIAAEPVPSPPQLGPAPSRLDIEALSRAGSGIVAGEGARSATPPALRIFVTLDMPTASLRLLLEQAERAGAVLVLRGLKAQSMHVTLEAVRSLIGERKLGWLIDPEAFTRYGIQHAPTFVLALDDASAGTGSCTGTCSAGAFLAIAGDVSLDYALEAMRRQRPGAAPRIDAILQRLRSS